MPAQLSQEQFWKLYEKLPQELKDSLWAQDTGDTIYEICKRYNATSYLQSIVQFVGQVFLGLLLPQDFQKEIGALGVGASAAKNITQEINRFLFYPVKPTLEQLHKLEIEVSAKVVTPEPPAAEAETPRSVEQKPEEEQRGPDSYRESIE
ncbi:MAG: hypothetical protein HYW96_01440 [Candidatus Wildermuthbacteria bacterium]|nr:hypothetical protein [Candidatus Wildermuthbacteria bacterium]